MTTIEVFGPIGAGGVTAAAVAGALKSAKPGPIRVQINSPGGDVFEGLAIYNQLKAVPDVTVAIIGLAASIASVIALAGKRVEMAEGALLMVHAAWSTAGGNAAELRDQADLLDKVSEQLAGIYASRTGKSAQEVAAWLSGDTWFDAAEAKAAGFIDAIIDGGNSAPFATAWRFQGAPAGIAARLAPDTALRAEIERLNTELSRARREAAAARVDAELGANHTVPVAAKAALVDAFLSNEAGAKALLATMKRQPRGEAPIPHLFPTAVDERSDYQTYLSRLPSNR